MPSRKMKKAGLGVSVALLSAVLLGSLFAGAIEPIITSVGNKSDSNISVDAAEPYAPVNTNYSAFADGATYQFSDITKYESFVADDSAQTCVTTITVDRSQPHGSQLNPYVIASEMNWSAFESEMGINHSTDASWTYGAGKFYVLATDIDFQDKTVVPMYAFGGTFYGQGHTLKNYHYTETVNINSTQAASNPDENIMGLWRWAYWEAGNSNVTIADLNFEFVYENCNGIVGGFFGWSQADDLEMINCHVKGVMKRMTPHNNWVGFGGLVGYVAIEDATSTRNLWACFMQCSAKLETEAHETMPKNSSFTIGGILSQSYWHVNTYFADCYTEVYGKTVNTASDRTNSTIWAGGIAGCLQGGKIGGLKTAMTGGSHQMYRCVSRLYVDATQDDCQAWLVGSLMAYYHQHRSATNASKYRVANSTFKVQDCYSFGGIDWINNSTNVRTRCPIPQWIYQTGNTNTATNWQHGYAVMDSSGNYFASEKTGVVSTTDYPYNYGTGTNNTTEVSDTTNFWNTVKSSTATVLKPKVWEHKDHIFTGALRTTGGDTGTFRNTGTFLIEYPDYYDNTTMVNDYNDYCSPVKGNVVRPIFDVEFYDLNKTGSSFSEKKIDVSSVTGYHYKFGEQSPVALAESYNFTTALPSTRRFVGWTQNKNWTHGTTYDTSFTPPDGMHGNIKYYRIMEATDATATISTQGDKTEAEYGSSITMIANIVCPSISGTSVTYTWKKDGQTASTGTRSTYLINQFDQTGEYSFGYTLTDSTMPLVYASGTSSNSVDLSITAKSVRVQTFTVTSENVFAGMELKDVTFTVAMVDADNRPVTGTAKWEKEIDKVVEGENTANIIFTPDDTSNYTKVTVPVTFTASAIKLTFTMSQVSSSIEATLNYKQTYSAAQIVEVFEKAFADKLAADASFAASVSGRAPLLAGQELSAFGTVFTEVTENQTLAVTFVTRSYTVTLDKNDGSENPTETRTLSWNTLISPTPEVERNGYDLLGWYYTNDKGVDTKWDFDADRVTSNLTLTARWKALNLTLQSITVSIARAEAFVALSTVTDDDLTVIATYTTDDPMDPPVENQIHLSTTGGTGGYVIKYDGTDQELHYKSGGYTITVSYAYRGIQTGATTVTKTQNVTLTVNKIKIDTSKITFANKSEEYTGSAIKHEIATSAWSSITGINSVTHEYRQGTTLVSTDTGVTALGEYLVYVIFNTTEDYEAESIRATLKIRSQLVAVRVIWSTFPELVYDTTDLCPKSSVKVVLDSDGTTEVPYGNSPTGYRLIGQQNNETFINAGTHTMTVVLGEDLKFAAGQTQSKNFIIKRASVPKPSLSSMPTLEYNGGDISVQGYLNNYNPLLVGLSGESATNAGDHTLTVSLLDTNNYQWEGGTSYAPFTIRWKIERQSLYAPTLMSDSYDYNGTEYNIKDLLTDFNENLMELELTYRAVNASPASGYRARVKLRDTTNYQWASSQVTDFVWRINKAVVAKPTFDGAIELDYAGDTVDVGEQISGYDYTVMKLSTNSKQRNAGTYTSTLSLLDSNNYIWDDGTSTNVQVKWTINKLTISPVWESQDTYTQDGGRHSPKIIDFTGLVGSDFFNQTADVTYGGKSNQTAVGGYITEATLKASWASNYTVDAAEMKKGYRIIRAGETGDTTDVQIPDTGNGSGGNQGGNGSGGGSGNQGGDNQGGNGSGGNGSGGTIGDNSGGNIFASGLPIVQLIISGIALILTVVFVCCTISDASRCKRAKEKVATMSVAPFALLAPFLGVASGGWWGIAGACVVLCIVTLAVMLVFKNKRKAAEGELADKVAEEKEEAQRRRDDDFKMMMASMMNRPMPESSGPSGFDVQALLTGMQESMGNMITALLPATTAANQANSGESETVKLLLAQNSEMMDRLNNQQPVVDTSASDERIRELEERMAEQQRLADERLQAERAEAMRREDEARKAQQEMLQRQEEMFRRFMENNNPPVAGGVGSNTTNSFVYEVEEEKLSIDRLTLAEAYEALTANSKKLFDAIGEYVMAKPETAESDGKYAISFKYRAKALFKLVIKRGIPTIAYSTEGEQLRQLKRDAASEDGVKVRFRLNELQVLDSSTLDIAKGVVDLRIEQIDKDIEYVKAQKAAKKKASKLS